MCPLCLHVHIKCYRKKKKSKKKPVPIGEQVTWCHRMVICAKKNGTPRRTIDFQPLNIDATRETHCTQSPFHQARSVPQRKKKPSLTHGMVTTVYSFILKTNTTPLLSPLGAADTAQPHNGTLPQVTDTPGDTMRSPHPSQAKPDA